jgi:ribonuclease HII
METIVATPEAKVAIATTQDQPASEVEDAGPPVEDSEVETPDHALEPELGEAQEPEDSKLKTQGSLIPTWDHELELFSRGYELLAGVDEAGRGSWAGPLVAAAVIFHPDAVAEARCAAGRYGELARLRDSKLLSPCVREELLECVRSTALALGVGVVSPALLDLIGLGPANRLAMTRAVRALDVRPDFLLLDAFRLPAMPIPQRPIIKGDATCMSISAASVLAKVARDRMMCELDAEYPGYGFAQHKGYGTHLHAQALERLGVLPIHRRSFAPISRFASVLRTED